MTRKAFTLIEVLLAVFIIGLGSIGLFALLAGVAQQQARSSDLSRSIAKLRDVLAVTTGALGPIAALDAPNNIDPVFDAPIVDGVWYPMFMYEDPTSPGFGYGLTVAPEIGNSFARSRYFVVDAGEEEVYSNPAVRDGSGFRQRRSEEFSPDQITPLEQRRVHFGSVAVEIYASNRVDGRDRLVETFEDVALLASPPSQMDAVTIPSTDGASTSTVTFDYDDRSPDDTASRRGVYDVSLQPGALQANEWISSIRVRYAHRSDRLVGLNERMNYILNSAGERQADSGVTMLYRRAPNRRTQVLAIAYSVTPIEPRTRFFPNEVWNGEDGDLAAHGDPIGPRGLGLLRVSNDYRLGYDGDRDEFFLTWSRPEDALNVGDIVIVGGDLDVLPSDPLNEQGADNPVVVTRLLTVQGEDRAYLSDSPRFRSRSMLSNFAGTASLSRVYSLRRQVESVDRERNNEVSLWDVRPVAYQVLDVQ